MDLSFKNTKHRIFFLSLIFLLSFMTVLFRLCRSPHSFIWEMMTDEKASLSCSVSSEVFCVCLETSLSLDVWPKQSSVAALTDLCISNIIIYRGNKSSFLVLCCLCLTLRAVSLQKHVCVALTHSWTISNSSILLLNGCTYNEGKYYPWKVWNVRSASRVCWHKCVFCKKWWTREHGRRGCKNTEKRMWEKTFSVLQGFRTMWRRLTEKNRTDLHVMCVTLRTNIKAELS